MLKRLFQNKIPENGGIFDCNVCFIQLIPQVPSAGNSLIQLTKQSRFREIDSTHDYNASIRNHLNQLITQVEVMPFASPHELTQSRTQVWHPVSSQLSLVSGHVFPVSNHMSAVSSYMPQVSSHISGQLSAV